MCSARRPSSKRCGARGMSLLEALAATALLGTALLAFSSNSISLTRSEKTADNVSAAMGLAQERLELMRSYPLGCPQHNPGNYADATTLKADGTANGLFTRTWTVS